MARGKPLSLMAVGATALAAAVLWGAQRAWLQARWGLPILPPGSLLWLALLAASAGLVLEEPRLAPGGGARLGWAVGGLALLALGESLLYYRVPYKDPYAGLGLGLLLAGAALLGPWPRSARRAALVAAGGLLAIGAYTASHPALEPWDIYGGPTPGQGLMLGLWGVLLLGLAVLAWGATAARPRLAPAPALAPRREALLLGALLLAAAALRFWRAGALPAGWWFDEVNLTRVVRDQVLNSGQAPLYVTQQVENPGAYLWLAAALFKALGVHIAVLRVTAGAFGLLALLPFWALARFWMGPRWALACTFTFGLLRWVAIPERIAFMSGFALFWMLASFWALWSAQLRPPASPGRRRAWPWRWLLAGLLVGANLHTYTPARIVPPLVLGFLLLQAWIDPAWRRRSADWMALGLGFLASAGPMLFYIAGHWSDYLRRAQEVSLFHDVAKTGHPLLQELWVSVAKHLLMFNFRGDYNGRHNLSFYPHADFLLGCALAVALPWTLGRARHDARARFAWLWLGAMLAAAVLSLPVEAPQGHRSILAAPALVLLAFLGLRELLAPLADAFEGGWPATARVLGVVLLLGGGALSADEVLRRWPNDPATFRSFSPQASAVLRRVRESQPGTAVYLSALPQQYQFDGFEWAVFAGYGLSQQGRAFNLLSPAMLVAPVTDAQPTRDVLLIWGETDTAISAAFAKAYPDIPVEAAQQPYPAPDQPRSLYLAAVVPYSRLPLVPATGPRPLLSHTPDLH